MQIKYSFFNNKLQNKKQNKTAKIGVITTGKITHQKRDRIKKKKKKNKKEIIFTPERQPVHLNRLTQINDSQTVITRQWFLNLASIGDNKKTLKSRKLS